VRATPTVRAIALLPTPRLANSRIVVSNSITVARQPLVRLKGTTTLLELVPGRNEPYAGPGCCGQCIRRGQVAALRWAFRQMAAEQRTARGWPTTGRPGWRRVLTRDTCSCTSTNGGCSRTGPARWPSLPRNFRALFVNAQPLVRLKVQRLARTRSGTSCRAQVPADARSAFAWYISLQTARPRCANGEDRHR
jgi:hypothetical protein